MNPNMTDLEYSVRLFNAFKSHHVDRANVHGGILSSVVPTLTEVLKKAISRVFGFEPFIVKPTEQRLVNIRIDRPEELGSNLLNDAVAVKMLYRYPAIIVDMGRATSFGVLDARGDYVGGLIFPGAQSSMDALTKKAAALFHVQANTQVAKYGRTTEDSINGGMIYGNAALIDNILDRITEERHFENPFYIATGHLSSIMHPFLSHDVTIDEYLSLKGMALLYEEAVK